MSDKSSEGFEKNFNALEDGNPVKPSGGLEMSLAKYWFDMGKQEKLQAAEEKLTECASNYWKEVEKGKAVEEENKILREAVEFYARKENWTRRGSQFRLADYGEDDGHSYRYGYLARQALEKLK